MKIQSTIRKALQPRLTERNPGRSKMTTGAENVLVNTTGDIIEPSATFVVFKDKAVHGEDIKGNPVLKVRSAKTEGASTFIREGWVPKSAFQEVDQAYYLPTYQYSPTSSLIGGVSRGLVSAGVPGAVAGVAGGIASSLVPKSALTRFGIGSLAGAGALTAYQIAFHGQVGIASALFAGGMVGAISSASGDGDASVRDLMLGGTAAGLAATLATGLPLGVLTGSAATALGAQFQNRTGQVLASAGIGAALTTAQAMITGGPLGLAMGIGAAVGGVGALLGPSLGQAGRNLQETVKPAVTGGVRKLLAGRGETAYKLASAVPQALAFGGLGTSVGLLAPGLGPVGAVLGATIGGANGYLRAGKRINYLKSLKAQRVTQSEPVQTELKEKAV